jgi:DNA-3-methyladenine glycosylase II
MLVKVKGIGPWTAEMFLLFSVGRENVFSVLDLGLRNGLMKLYQKELSEGAMLEISKKWHPYKSVVSHYLWRYNAKK